MKLEVVALYALPVAKSCTAYCNMLYYQLQGLVLPVAMFCMTDDMSYATECLVRECLSQGKKACAGFSARAVPGRNLRTHVSGGMSHAVTRHG